MHLLYLETSGLNYLLDNLDHDAVIGTKEFQLRQKTKFVFSPVTLWEVMLNSNKDKADKMLFYMQSLGTEKLLASPSELITRYLEFSYPENNVNYDVFSNSDIGNVWTKMVHDSKKTMVYDLAKLKKHTYFLRKISKKFNQLVTSNQDLDQNLDQDLESIKLIINLLYECLKRDGFLNNEMTKDLNKEKYFKIVILFVLIIFYFRADIVSSCVEPFLKKTGIFDRNPTALLGNIFEKYNDILYVGPIAELSIMAYNQVENGSTNRGLILDCYHMIYAPYTNAIITSDVVFSNIKNMEKHYHWKVFHTSELLIREVSFPRSWWAKFICRGILNRILPFCNKTTKIINSDCN